MNGKSKERRGRMHLRQMERMEWPLTVLGRVEEKPLRRARQMIRHLTMETLCLRCPVQPRKKIQDIGGSWRKLVSGTRREDMGRP